MVSWEMPSHVKRRKKRTKKIIASIPHSLLTPCRLGNGHRLPRDGLRRGSVVLGGDRRRLLGVLRSGRVGGRWLLGLERLGEELAHLRLPQRPRDPVDTHLHPRSKLLCLDVVLCSEPPGAFRDYVNFRVRSWHPPFFSPSPFPSSGTRRTLQLKIVNEGLLLRDWDGHRSRLLDGDFLGCGWSWRGLAFLYGRHRFFLFFSRS